MRILVVEDEPQMAEQLRKGLEREGYAVLVAHDGQEALHLARTVEHDLMVLDWMLPKVDGRQVARRLREAKIGTRILMLTARDAPPDIVEGLDCGADDYLVKPFAFEVLLARLRALARRVADARPAVLCVADLVLERSSRRCGATKALSRATRSMRSFIFSAPRLIRARIASSSIPCAVSGIRSGRLHPHESALDRSEADALVLARIRRRLDAAWRRHVAHRSAKPLPRDRRSAPRARCWDRNFHPRS
jgi:CheY-like chemotaxis protein